jgi:hypothetical protein
VSASNSEKWLWAEGCWAKKTPNFVIPFLQMSLFMKPSIEITFLPSRYQGYFDWFLTGLGMLQQRGELELSVRQPAWQKALRLRIFGKLPLPLLMPSIYDSLCPIDYYCLTGRLRVRDRLMNFVLDISDSPFTFAPALLETADLYFKCQCPARFESSGFPLNSQVRIPYHPDVFGFAHKIRPAMFGRPLAYTTNLARNTTVLKKWDADGACQKSIRIFASFGSDRYPKPYSRESAPPAPYNYESEAILLARWGDAVHHPNHKRGRIVGLLRALNKPDISARLFNSSNADNVGPRLSEQEYQRSLQQAAVNVNISGFRRSLPYRFIDTFLTGGMVATDTLAVRWYKPFESGVEVTELGDLGYEPECKVKWPEVQARLLEIYETAKDCGGANANAVRDQYLKKWSPPAFAAHFLQECLNTLEAQ